MLFANSRALRKLILPGALLFFLSVSVVAFGQDPKPVADSDFVQIKRIDPSIVIDLRYAGPNNFVRRPLYRPGMPALVRYSVARRLVVAQKYLKEHGFRLKIWDAYRPQAAHRQLWEANKNNSYVADPTEGVGSMHTRGAAVDATLVDLKGKEVPMPTDFDNFTPAAMTVYQGSDPVVRANLKLLQKAMGRAGFYGLRTEWWHFCAADWMSLPPVPEIPLLADAPRAKP